jgi:hypothetical protein
MDSEFIRELDAMFEKGEVARNGQASRPKII